MTSFSEKIYNSSPTWIQNQLVSLAGYLLYKKRYTGNVAKQLKKDLKIAATWNKQQIESFQNEKLHEMVKFCSENIPYYKTLFAEINLKSNDITSTKDLAKIPTLSKDILKASPDLFKAPKEKPYVIQNTSGSSGTPLSVWVNEYTYKLAMALVVEHEEKQEVYFGDKRATFAGRMIQPIGNLNAPFSRFNKYENQRIYSSYHLNENTFPEYEKDLNKFSPKEIIGYPSAIYELAYQFKQKKTKPKFKLKTVITNSETLLEWQRTLIEDVFDVKVKDYYGSAEYVMFSSQCFNQHYHLNPLIGITEIVDLNGNPIIEEEGDVIATTLTNFTMPLLRYKIGDRAKLSYAECSCGNNNSFFKSILGRIDDIVTTTDGRKIGRLDHIFKGIDGIKEAQIIQKTKTLCNVNVVVSMNKEKINTEKVKKALIDRTSNDMQVKINFVESIPKGKNGKFKSVISELNNE